MKKLKKLISGTLALSMAAAYLPMLSASAEAPEIPLPAVQSVQEVIPENAGSAPLRIVSPERNILDPGEKEYTPYTDAAYNLKYKEKTDGTLEITGWTGTASGELVIPNTIENKLVTSIKYFAFSECSGFTGSLVIPDTITAIGNWAFSNCSGFTGTLTIPDSVTSIGQGVFDGCKGFTGTLSIPDTVTTIEDWAFHNCSGFTGALTIPDSVTSIGEGAFMSCDGFTGTAIFGKNLVNLGISSLGNGITGIVVSAENTKFVSQDGILFTRDMSEIVLCPRGKTGTLTIPDTVKIIQKNAFEHCTNLTGSLTIPNSVTTIEENAFSQCENLTGNLVIPDSVTTIGTDAFAFCRKLGTVTLGKGVEKLSSLGYINPDMEIVLSPENPYYTVQDGMIFTKDMTKIVQCMPSKSGQLVIPDGVTTIGENAFEQCQNFTGTLIIPNDVTTIEKNAFLWCYNIGPEVYISASHIKSIHNLALWGCSTVKDVYFAGSEEQWNAILSKGQRNSFTGKTMHYNSSLDTINFTVEFKDWDGTVISSNKYHLGDKIVVPEDPTRPDDATFTYTFAGWDKDIVDCAGSAVYTAVYTNEYKGYRPYPDASYSLTYTEKADGTLEIIGHTGTIAGELVIPNTIENKTVTSIGNSAFSDCDGFTGTLTIPDSVTSIGDYAFSFCHGFTGALTIPESVTSIGEGAFMFCYGFTGTLTIPDTVTSIGYSAFADCDGFTGALTIPDSVISIGDYAFSNCDGFTGSLTIPDSVTTIGMGIVAFSNGFTGTLTLGKNVIDMVTPNIWSNFTEIVVSPENPKFASQDGMLFTKDMTKLLMCPQGKTGTPSIPSTVTTIGRFSFYDCKSLTGNLKIPDNVTTIEQDAFAFYDGLGYTLTIGKGVMNLSYLGYIGPNVEIVISPENPYYTLQDGMIFTKDMTKIVQCIPSKSGQLVIPDGVTTIGDNAFENCDNLTGSLIFPDSVTSIEKYAFSRCDNIGPEVYIPASHIQSIYGSAFAGCNSVTDVYFAGSQEQWNSIYNTESGDFLDGKTMHFNSMPPVQEFTVEFKNWDGTVISSNKYHLGDEITVPENPTRPDDDTYTYTFTGWDKEVVNCTGNAVYTAQYRADKLPQYAEGWNKDSSGWFYVKNSQLLKNEWVEENGLWSYLDADGYMLTGWQKIGNFWFHIDSHGHMQTGWQNIENKWYLFDVYGHMQTGWQWIDGTWYKFDASGVMQESWQWIDGWWYFFDGSGHMTEGWLWDGNFWYLFDGSGHMQMDWQWVDGIWYLFDQSGHMQTGWQWREGIWYYFNYSGHMLTGAHTIDGVSYTFNGSGHLVETA